MTQPNATSRNADCHFAGCYIFVLFFECRYTKCRGTLLTKNDQNTIFYGVQCALFYIENDSEIFPAHFTWKVVEKGFKIAFMMNKLAMINSFEIILEK